MMHALRVRVLSWRDAHQAAEYTFKLMRAHLNTVSKARQR
jgi:hypothetical protein